MVRKEFVFLLLFCGVADSRFDRGLLRFLSRIIATHLVFVRVVIDECFIHQVVETLTLDHKNRGHPKQNRGGASTKTEAKNRGQDFAPLLTKLIAGIRSENSG